LRICAGRPSRKEKQREKHYDSPHQTVEQVENACANNQGEEEQLSLSPEDG
jgi:hypothetical protein